MRTWDSLAPHSLEPVLQSIEHVLVELGCDILLQVRRAPLVLHGNLLSQVHAFEIPANGYNWGRMDVPLKMYMHTITRFRAPRKR